MKTSHDSWREVLASNDLRIRDAVLTAGPEHRVAYLTELVVHRAAEHELLLARVESLSALTDYLRAELSTTRTHLTEALFLTEELRSQQ